MKYPFYKSTTNCTITWQHQKHKLSIIFCIYLYIILTVFTASRIYMLHIKCNWKTNTSTSFFYSIHSMCKYIAFVIFSLRANKFGEWIRAYPFRFLHSTHAKQCSHKNMIIILYEHVHEIETLSVCGLFRFACSAHI